MSGNKAFAVAVACLLWSLSPAIGVESADTARPFEEVRIDLAARDFLGFLPFDVPFYVLGSADATVQKVAIRYREDSVCRRCLVDRCSTDDPPAPGVTTAALESVPRRVEAETPDFALELSDWECLGHSGASAVTCLLVVDDSPSARPRAVFSIDLDTQEYARAALDDSSFQISDSRRRPARRALAAADARPVLVSYVTATAANRAVPASTTVCDECSSRCAWTPGSEWKRNSTTPATTDFRLKIDPLKSQRTYEFVVTLEREVAPAEAAAAAALAVQRYEKTLRKADVGTVSTDEIREALEQAAALGPNEELVEKDTRKIVESVNPLLAANDLYFEGAREFDATRLEVGPKLKGLFDLIDEAIREFGKVDELKNNEADFARVAALRERIKIGSGRLAVASGVDAGEPIEGVWDPALVAARKTALESAQEDLDLLESFVRNYPEKVAGKDLLPRDSSKPSSRKSVSEQIAAVREDLKTLRNAATTVTNALGARTDAVVEARDLLARRIREEYSIVGSTSGDFETRHKWYLGFDLGVARADELEEALAYAGVNLHFAPIAKNASFKDLKDLYGRRGAWKRRFSLAFGITNESIAKAGVRKGFIGDRGMMFGLGCRLRESFRLTVGALAFKEVDPDPLVSEEDPAFDIFLSFSFDASLRQLFGGIGEAFGFNGQDDD